MEVYKLNSTVRINPQLIQLELSRNLIKIIPECIYNAIKSKMCKKIHSSHLQRFFKATSSEPHNIDNFEFSNETLKASVGIRWCIRDQL